MFLRGCKPGTKGFRPNLLTRDVPQLLTQTHIDSQNTKIQLNVTIKMKCFLPSQPGEIC